MEEANYRCWHAKEITCGKYAGHGKSFAWVYDNDLDHVTDICNKRPKTRGQIDFRNYCDMRQENIIPPPSTEEEDSRDSISSELADSSYVEGVVSSSESDIPRNAPRRVEKSRSILARRPTTTKPALGRKQGVEGLASNLQKTNQTSKPTRKGAAQKEKGSSRTSAEEGPVELKVQPKYLDFIRSGSKTFEGRLANKTLKGLRPGEMVQMVSSLPEEAPTNRLACRVKGVRTFQTFRDMLTECGLDKCLPGCASIDDGVKVYHGFAWYAHGEKKGKGIVAIEIEADVITSDSQSSSDASIAPCM